MHKHIPHSPLSPPSSLPLSLLPLLPSSIFPSSPSEISDFNVKKNVLFQPNKNSKISSSVPIQSLSYNSPLASFFQKDSLPSILKSSSPNKIDFIMIQTYNTFSKETLDKH